MSRPATGQVVERRGKRGRTFALRFRAYGRRRYVTLGTAEEGWTSARAEQELANVLADVRRGIWREPDSGPVVEDARPEPTFHEFASEWLQARRQEGLGARTLEDYEWALSYHLLPYLGHLPLGAITVREVDRYKTAKAAEGILSPNSINKTLTRLSQILAVAVEYELLPANPAAGRRRRLKGTRPRRTWIEPEQLMALLEAAEGSLGGRGRPLLATLAGAGLRIGEALALRWRDVDLARGTLRVGESKTEAGVRMVDLTPALRSELVAWKLRSHASGPNELVFPTAAGGADNRNNVRRRLVLPAVERANAKLAEAGIEPIGPVSPHGFRHTYASLRHAAGDDAAYTSEQLGHTNPTFTMSVYTHAAKHRGRLSQAEREAFTRALEWAQMGTSGMDDLEAVALTANVETQEPAL